MRRSSIEICGQPIKIAGRLLRVGSLDADKFQYVENPEVVLDGLRKCGRRIDLFTFIQRPPETTPKYDYPMEWDNLAVLPVTTFDHWWTKQIGFKARNKAKQAEKKGVMVRETPLTDLLVQGICEIFNESPVRQGRAFPHYGKDLRTVHDDVATFLDSSVFIGCFLGDSLIGYVKLVLDETRTVAGLMNIVSMIRERDKAPTNALLAQVVRSCADRGISYLVYSNYSYGKKQQSSLSDFKERNGFQRVDLPRYYVPLTTMGSIALRLGLHRKVTDWVPESLASRLRDLRSAWYNRKFQSGTEAS